MSTTVQQPPDTRPPEAGQLAQEWTAIPLGSVHGGVWPNEHTEPSSWVIAVSISAAIGYAFGVNWVTVPIFIVMGLLAGLAPLWLRRPR